MLFNTKTKIYLHFRSLIRTSELRSKVLSLGKLQIYLHFRSLIRTFAAAKYAFIICIYTFSSFYD